MESNEKQLKYASILDIIESMKKDVVETSMQRLLMTGVMPESARNELKVLSQITGAVFNGIISIGAEVYEDEENEDIVYSKIDGKKYSCAKTNISDSISITSEPLSASEAYSMTAKPVENVEQESQPKETAKKVSIEEFEKTVNSENDFIVEESAMQKESDETYETEDAIDEEPYVEDANVKQGYQDQVDSGYKEEETTVVEETSYQEPESQVESEESESDWSEKPSIVDDEILEDDDFGAYEQPQRMEPSGGALQPEEREVSGEVYFQDEEETNEEVEPDDVEVPAPQAAEVRPFQRSDVWEEEYTKNIDTMVYNMLKLTVVRIGSGKPEEIIAMIAPLKISKFSSPAVPIVVTLYNRGKVVTKSSYDMGDGGKSIVTLEINDFYLLCRGSFDENGQFNSFITTTGLSSQQGDKINLVSSKKYGNAKEPGVNNGHIKVRYASESGDGTIEVFPFGTQKDDEFIIMVKNPEFCDTYYINQRGRTGTSAIIYGVNCKLEVVPSWNGDDLEVEVFEK